MPQATRKEDKCTGHDACPPIELDTGSSNVFINKLPAGRKTDIYKPHGCSAHTPHPDQIIKGSSTVFINRLPAARIGDDVIIGGRVMEGSDNVMIGG